MSVISAARGVTQVMHRCEAAKETGFLDLSGCDLMYVADAIYLVLKGDNVTKCSLSNNALKKFPIKLITKFPDMIQFSIASNSVTDLPEEISNWKKLKAINLAKNKFAKIPEAIYQMTDLQVLDLSDNEIENIDIKRLISSLPNLKLLNLSNNPLPVKHLQDIFGHQTKTLQIKYVVSETEMHVLNLIWITFLLFVLGLTSSMASSSRVISNSMAQKPKKFVGERAPQFTIEE